MAGKRDPAVVWHRGRYGLGTVAGTQFTVVGVPGRAGHGLEVEADGGRPWLAAAASEPGRSPQASLRRLARAIEAGAAIESGKGASLRPSDAALGRALADGDRAMAPPARDARAPAHRNLPVTVSGLAFRTDRRRRRYAVMTIRYGEGAKARAIAFSAALESLGDALREGPATVFGRFERGRFLVLSAGLATAA